MSIASARPPATVAPPAPAPAPPPADREPGAAPFAEWLRQSRGVERRPEVDAASGAGARHRPRGEPAAARGPTPSTTTTATTIASDDGPAASEGGARSDAGRARVRNGVSNARPTPRPTGNAEPAQRDGTTAAAADAAADDEKVAADATTSPFSAQPAHPSRLEPRASDAELRLGGATRRLGLDSGGGAAVDDRCDTRSQPWSDAAAASPRGLSRRATGDAATRVDAGRPARPGPEGDGAGTSSSFATQLGDAKAADRVAATAASAVEPMPAAAGAAPALPARSATAVADGSSAPAATIPAPVDSPDFPAAFGVQVSLLVKDGVQQAELHLNPAETGPVSVAISVSGTQAHVEFGADLAATRQAIENGLPALASALREAGFTLAGGGVAQHSRSGAGGGEDEASGDGRRGRRESRGIEAPASDEAARRSNHRLNAGGIDLYA